MRGSVSPVVSGTHRVSECVSYGRGPDCARAPSHFASRAPARLWWLLQDDVAEVQKTLLAIGKAGASVEPARSLPAGGEAFLNGLSTGAA